MTVPRNALSGYHSSPPSDAPTIIFSGVSGRTYPFRLYELGQVFKPLPGAYVLCKETSPNVFDVLYVGETHDLDNRVGTNFSEHHKWAAAILAGATHVCARVVHGGKADRLAVEADLRQFYNPPLTRHYVANT